MRGRISAMLSGQKKHISFHTPGHKRAGKDITELDYSDNLASPTGVIKGAEEDVARILGADKSFLLTDGSTSGIHAILYALRAAGKRTVAYPTHSHASVFGGCKILGLSEVKIPTQTVAGIPLQPTLQEVEEALARADALLLTSPDYYGNFPDLEKISALCKRLKKPLVVDGAHGAHLHGEILHASNYAQMWVDGAHKSLPTLTQGAVVSAKGEWCERLHEGVLLFRTSSPSYPILASVEEGIKYPKKHTITLAAQAFKQEVGALDNADWTKVVVPFGEYCDLAQHYLQSKGIYPEFNDGNYLVFYLSPMTKLRHLRRLKKLLLALPRGGVSEVRSVLSGEGVRVEEVALPAAVGRTCARECGLFPPCLPLLVRGELITASKIQKLLRAKSTFGLKDGKISVFVEE